MRSDKYKKALQFVKEKHAGQVRAGDTPTWYHLARVSYSLEILLEKYQEGTKEEQSIIPLAALGHDVLEDTDATHDEVRSVFGARGLELIVGMTNEWGDEDVKPYVEKVSNAEEAIRLIKLSDLYDNISNSTYCMSLLGREWAVSFFLPIVTPMRESIIKTGFSTYARTAGEFKSMVEHASLLLDSEIERFTNAQ